MWFGSPCTQTYWDDITPIFKLLSDAKGKGLLFSELHDKANTIYRPILNAFTKELKSQASLHPGIARKLVEYLLGNFDFYKVISVDYDKYTQIQGFNMHGTLNQKAGTTKPTIKIPVVYLPSRIVCIEFAKDSDNTIEVYMDSGWQFSFRIHNGSKYVEPSLKFDIQIMGMPTAVFTINSLWNN